jgi:CO dehydrogenase maturation factor
MRIAFVGKGGSGKTTIAALFSQFLKKEKVENIISIDADINVHLPELLLGKDLPKDKFLSSPESLKMIKKYLIGENDFLNLETFRKTTPPNGKSKLIWIEDALNPIMKQFSIEKDGIKVMAVGTYDSQGIGASCYHNNLAILENILSHSVDKDGAIVVDMVAGTDAFASTLHVQFDLIVLVVEPTKRGVEVFNQYIGLAKSAGIEEDIFVVGNKISSDEDTEFLSKNISEDKLIGFVSNSPYIREHDKRGGIIDFDRLEKNNQELFIKIFESLINNLKDPNIRLNKIYPLHEKYVSQSFIKDRFGDLTNQIDPKFKFK